MHFRRELRHKDGLAHLRISGDAARPWIHGRAHLVTKMRKFMSRKTPLMAECFWREPGEEEAWR